MRRFAAIALLGTATSAAAQLHLPQVQLPQVQLPPAPLQVPKLPSTPDVTVPNTVLRGAQNALDPADLLGLRRLAIRDRLRQHGDVLESDPAGELIMRNELMVIAP